MFLLSLALLATISINNSHQDKCIYKNEANTTLETINCDLNTDSCFTIFNQRDKRSVYGCTYIPREFIKCTDKKPTCYHNTYDETICCCNTNECNNPDSIYSSIYDSIPDKTIENHIGQFWNAILLISSSTFGLIISCMIIITIWLLHRVSFD